MELHKYRVVAGAYDRVGLNEGGLQIRIIKKLILPFIEPYFSGTKNLPDIVILHLLNGFNEAPGLIQRACLPEGPNLYFPFQISVIVRKLLWHAFS